MIRGPNQVVIALYLRCNRGTIAVVVGNNCAPPAVST